MAISSLSASVHQGARAFSSQERPFEKSKEKYTSLDQKYSWKEFVRLSVVA
jgi:hypothetical protein